MAVRRNAARSPRLTLAPACMVLLAVACGESATSPVGRADVGFVAVDAESLADASSSIPDAELSLDAAPADAGATDADPADAEPADADPADADPEDAGFRDAEPAETGVPDQGFPDIGTLDLGVVATDSGLADAGPAACMISTTSLPAGQVRVPYIAQLMASGCPSPTWQVVAGTLPAGLGLVAGTGEIFGRPIQSVMVTVTVEASQAGYRSAMATLSIQIL